MSDEALLLIQLQKGSETAYKELFLKYYSPLSEYASQYIQDAEAEELVQDLMLHLWEFRKSLFIQTSLKSYLFTATRHRCLNAIKKNIYHKQIHHILHDKLEEQFEDPDYYMVNELSANIEKAINELPENYRETFVLSRFGEMTNLQIANRLGVSVKTIEYRITQSIKTLRVKLKDYLPLLTFLL